MPFSFENVGKKLDIVFGIKHIDEPLFMEYKGPVLCRQDAEEEFDLKVGKPLPGYSDRICTHIAVYFGIKARAYYKIEPKE